MHLVVCQLCSKCKSSKKFDAEPGVSILQKRKSESFWMVCEVKTVSLSCAAGKVLIKTFTTAGARSFGCWKTTTGR